MGVTDFIADLENRPPFFVTLFGSGDIERQKWNEVLDDLKDLIDSSPAIVQGFVITDAIVPSPGQRRQLWDLMRGRQRRLVGHVFTRSPLIRGVVTAYRWTTSGEAYCYAPNDFLRACEAANLDPNLIWRAATSMESQINTTHTLAAIRAALPPGITAHHTPPVQTANSLGSREI